MALSAIFSLVFVVLIGRPHTKIFTNKIHECLPHRILVRFHPSRNVVGHIAYVLLIVSMMMRTMNWLPFLCDPCRRISSIYYAILSDYVSMFWEALFSLVNLGQLISLENRESARSVLGGRGSVHQKMPRSSGRSPCKKADEDRCLDRSAGGRHPDHSGRNPGKTKISRQRQSANRARWASDRHPPNAVIISVR